MPVLTPLSSNTLTNLSHLDVETPQIKAALADWIVHLSVCVS